MMRSFVFSANPEKGYINRVLNHHKEIYKAVKSKDLSMAKQKMRDHFVDIKRKYSRIQVDLSSTKANKKSYLLNPLG